MSGTAATSRGHEPRDLLREETSLLGFINVLLRHRRLLLIAAIIGALILGVSELRGTGMSTAYASFTVRGSRALSPASELAARLGITSGSTGDETQSTAFYIDLIRSRAVLARVVELPYRVVTRRGTIQRSLASIYDIDDKSGALAKARTVEKLRERISTSTGGQTGVIVVSVEAEQPELAQQILRNVLRELDAYNIARRRGKAAAERDFVEKMLNDARAALTRAEGQLSAFRELNREYSSSPALTLENNRLAREVSMRQGIYTAMAQSYEQAKIEEVRDLPAITLLDQPEAAIASDTSNVIRKTLLGLVGGLLVGIVLAFARERGDETREAGTRAYTEYSALKKETLSDLTRPWGRVVRLFSS